MRPAPHIPDAPTQEVILVPLAGTGRYEISACVGHRHVITYSDDLVTAQTAFEESFAKPFADNRDAHGGIYDRDERRTVLIWRGGPKRPPEQHPMIAIYERAIASGAPVTIIAGNRCVDFNVDAGQGQ